VDQPDGTGQRSARDLRDAHGNGTVSDTTLDYQRNGVHLVHLKVNTTYAGITEALEFQPSPAPVVLPSGAAAGVHLHFTMSGSGTTADVTIDVLGMETLQIAARPVNTLALRTMSHFSGQVSGQTSQDSWVTPEHGLTVREHVVTDAQVGLDSFHSEYTAALQRMSPS